MVKLGLHPRLACVALAGGAEAVLPFSEYAEASPERQKIFVNDLKRRLKGLNAQNQTTKVHNLPSILSGFPDRLARISPETQPNADRAEYQFPSGRKAWLSRELLSQARIPSFPAWLVAPEVDAGERIGKIYSFEALSENQPEEFLKNHAKSEIRTEFVGLTNGSDFKNLSVQKKEILAYGAIILKEKKLPTESEDFALAVCDLVSKKGLDSLPLDSKIADFLLRTEFYIKNQSQNPHSEQVSAPERQQQFDSLAQKAKESLQPFVTS